MIFRFMMFSEHLEHGKYDFSPVGRWRAEIQGRFKSFTLKIRTTGTHTAGVI